jgi:hypothetical protein
LKESFSKSYRDINSLIINRDIDASQNKILTNTAPFELFLIRKKIKTNNYNKLDQLSYHKAEARL